MILANANDLAMIVNYNCNHSFIVLDTVIKIINYSCKTFIVQATGIYHQGALLGQAPALLKNVSSSGTNTLAYLSLCVSGE